MSQLFCIPRLLSPVFCLLSNHLRDGGDIAFCNAQRAIIVSHLGAAGALGLQVRQATFATLDFAAAGYFHALDGRFARFHFAHLF